MSGIESIIHLIILTVLIICTILLLIYFRHEVKYLIQQPYSNDRNSMIASIKRVQVLFMLLLLILVLAFAWCLRTFVQFWF